MTDLSQRASQLEDGKPTITHSHRLQRSVTVVLVVGLVILASIAVYQQFQITSLSGTISSQASELAHPTADLAILNFTVTKLNSASKPVLYLEVLNNGTAPASTANELVSVFEGNNLNDSCYPGYQGFFPLYSGWKTMFLAPLTCGNIGDTVVMSTSVTFLTSSGSVSKVFSSRTTISQSRFPRPSTVVLNHLGIKTYIIPETDGLSSFYEWSLVVTNDSPTPIVAVSATATAPNGDTTVDSGCVSLQGFFGISGTNQLLPGASCQDDNNLNPRSASFAIGTSFNVEVKVEFSNQTWSTVSTTVAVEPPYAIYQ
jgi:hypothetical protein